MGSYNWQSLYVQDLPDLEEMLNTQKSLIEEKYGECHMKIDTLIMMLLKKLYYI